MTRVTSLGRVLLAGGIIGLGIVGLVQGQFVRKWEPVPAGLPLRQWLAGASNLLLLAGGVGLLVPRAAAAAALALTLFLLSWIVILHGPLIVSHPSNVLAWSYVGGVLVLTAGVLTLWAMLPTPGQLTSPPDVTHMRVLTMARLLMGLTFVFFGITHIIYAQGVTPLVPAWIPIPLRVDVVYLVGCAHTATGLALISGVLAGTAATLQAAMMSSLVLLVDIPRFAAGLAGPPWALCFETAMVGGVWLVAGALDVRARPIVAIGTVADPRPGSSARDLGPHGRG